MFATVNGVNLYYERAGQGKPVLTLHGGLGIGDHGDNKKMFADLEEKYTFIYYDQRGNGQSDQCDPETYTHGQYVEDAEALRKHLDLGKTALSGGSYGGIIAMEYALLYPDSISCMVLRGTAASFELQTAAFENALKRNVPGVTKQLLEDLFFGRMESDDDLRDKFSKILPLYSRSYDPEKGAEMCNRKKFHSATHNAFFTREFPAYDIRERLHEISVPTLILAGRYDWITPIQFAEELAAGIPNAELVIFEDSGHSIHSDEPDKFYSSTIDFLERFS